MVHTAESPLTGIFFSAVMVAISLDYTQTAKKTPPFVKGRGRGGNLGMAFMAYPERAVYLAYETARVSRMTVIFT